MGIRTWMMGKFPALFRDAQEIRIHEEYCNLTYESYYKMLAIESAINLISNTLTQAEFKTFNKGQELKENNYYLFNVEANPNQNSIRFWKKVIEKLVKDNEALVIMQDDNLYVADKFQRKSFAFVPNIYTNIVIENYELKESFRENQVFYFELHSSKVQSLIDGLYDDYGKLIEYSKTTYKRANARRGILNIPTNYPQTERAQQELKNLLEKHFKAFFEAESGAVLPLSNGMTFEDLTNSTYKNSSDSRDIKNLVDDVFDYVAVAFQIPPSLLKGGLNSVNDEVWTNYLTNCLNPIAELLEKEINRKYYGKKSYLEKSYLKVDTSLINPTYIIKLSNTLDILTRNGINTLNDNLRMLGRNEVEDLDLGEKRFMTLNLYPMNKLEEKGTMKGGEQNLEE